MIYVKSVSIKLVKRDCWFAHIIEFNRHDLAKLVIRQCKQIFYGLFTLNVMEICKGCFFLFEDSLRSSSDCLGWAVSKSDIDNLRRNEVSEEIHVIRLFESLESFKAPDIPPVLNYLSQPKARRIFRILRLQLLGVNQHYLFVISCKPWRNLLVNDHLWHFHLWSPCRFDVSSQINFERELR